MAWTISYTATVTKQLRNLDRPIARRLIDFMDERIAAQADPRSTGQALRGPLRGAYWRYRVGDYRIICDIQDGGLKCPGDRDREPQRNLPLSAP